MIHQEHTAITNRAVMRPRRLDVFAFLALLMPVGFELCDGLVPVFEQSFDFSRESLEPVIFNMLDLAILSSNLLCDTPSRFTLFELLPQLFDSLEV